MGNFDTSHLATLHGLLDDPLPSSRPIVGILEPAAKVEPELVHEDAPLWGCKIGHLWYKSYSLHLHLA
jgi:hypothetical protein